MRNILTLFRNDFARLFRNVMSVIIVVGLVVTPSIFAWYNIIACWNVFDNTGNLKVAVANVDEGYESDLIPLRINVGEQVISELRANEDIDWVFTTEEDAIDGAQSGRYYAAVVIPESFSRDMLTFYSRDSQHADIIYYANEKKSAIAPKITDQGADGVSSQVNEVFAETLSEVALGIAESLSSYVEESDADGRVADLSEHMRSMADQIDQAASTLKLYSSLAQSSADLAASSADLMGNVRDELGEVSSEAQDGMDLIDGSLDSLNSSAKSLSEAVRTSGQSLEALGEIVDALFDDASADTQGCVERMRQQASAVDAQSARYREVAAQLEQLGSSASPDHALVIDAAIASINSACDMLDRVSTRLGDAADELEAGDADVSDVRAEVRGSIAEAQGAVSDLQTSLEQDFDPVLSQLVEECASLAGDVGSGLGTLDVIGSDLTSSVDSAAGTLSAASGEISSATGELADAATELRSLASAIDGALASGGADALRDVLGANVQSLASALASPVGVERVAVFPTENFGSAMAPLYTTLALFIGSLLIMITIKPQVSELAQSGLRSPRPHELFLGRFGVVAFISLLQTTLMGLGNMFFLQVQVSHPLLFMLCFWVSGLVFAFIVYALVSAFANLGKAAVVILLVVQVTGCGGSFPLEILPSFVQTISPFLPATHVVNAMRAAMFGTRGADFWIEMGCVALFLAPAAIVGLILRRPLAKFMAWYIEKVESSKLMG